MILRYPTLVSASRVTLGWAKRGTGIYSASERIFLKRTEALRNFCESIVFA